MADGAPRLELNTDYPTLDPPATGSTASADGYGTSNQRLKDATNGFLSSAQSALNAVQTHPVTQNVKETVKDGPVAQSVKNQASITSSEFRDLANSRTTPDQPAATGQPLTHYHSMFYRLLSWKNPRATAVSYATIVLFIFSARYLDVLRHIFRALYVVLGITASAEIAGKALFGAGFASQMRPRRYYVIPRESLEMLLEDVEQLINFFVIELQRIVFAENLYATLAVFSTAFVSYWLIRWLPLWGLSLIATTVAYLGPLVYIKNRELIDSNVKNMGDVINKQAVQVKELATQHTNQASEKVKTYAGEYSHKAQKMMGSAKQRTEAAVHRTEAAVSKHAPTNYSSGDFPNAPKQAPASSNLEDRDTYKPESYQTDYQVDANGATSYQLDAKPVTAYQIDPNQATTYQVDASQVDPYQAGAQRVDPYKMEPIVT